MPSIRKGQKLFKGIDYIGNFLGEPVEIGNIYRCDDSSFVLLANITDLISAVTLANLTETSTRQNITYTKESSIDVKVNAGADGGAGKGDIELNFRRKNSAFVSLKDITVSALKLQLVETALKKVWEKEKWQNNGRYVVVNQVMKAKSGTIIFSEDRGNKVVLKATSGEKLSSALKAGSGNVEFVKKSKAVLEIISPEPILPMFKAFYYRRNGEIEVFG